MIKVLDVLMKFFFVHSRFSFGYIESLDISLDIRRNRRIVKYSDYRDFHTGKSLSKFVVSSIFLIRLEIVNYCRLI